MPKTEEAWGMAHSIWKHLDFLLLCGEIRSEPKVSGLLLPAGRGWERGRSEGECL